MITLEADNKSEPPNIPAVRARDSPMGRGVACVIWARPSEHRRMRVMCRSCRRCASQLASLGCATVAGSARGYDIAFSPTIASGRAVAQTLNTRHEETAHPLGNGLGRGVELELAGRGGFAEAVIHNGSEHCCACPFGSSRESLTSQNISVHVSDQMDNLLEVQN